LFLVVNVSAGVKITKCRNFSVKCCSRRCNCLRFEELCLWRET